MVDLFYDIFTTLYNQYNQAVAAAQKVNNGGGTTGTKTTPTQTVTLTEQQQTALGQVSSLTGAINQALLKFKADFITNNGGFVVKTFNGVNNTNATVALQTCLTQLMSDYNAVQTAVANAKAAYTILSGAPVGTGKGVAAAMQSLKSAYSAQNSGADYYLPNQGTNFNLTLTNYASYTGLQNYLGTAVTNIQNAYNVAMQIAPMQKQQPSTTTTTTTTTPTALTSAQQSALNNYTADITALNNAVTAAQAQISKDQSTYVTQLQQATTTSAVTTAYNNGISALANDFIAAMANCCVNNDVAQGPISTATGTTTGTVAAPLLNLQNDLANLSSIPSTATQYQAAQNAIPTVQAAIAAAMDTANAFPIDAYILTPGVLNSSTISTYADVSATGNGALGAALIALQNAYNAANTRVGQQSNGGASFIEAGAIAIGAGVGLFVLALIGYLAKRGIEYSSQEDFDNKYGDLIDGLNKGIVDGANYTVTDVAGMMKKSVDNLDTPTPDTDGSLAISTVKAAGAAQKAATENLGSSATPEEVDAAAQAGFAEAFDFTPSDIEMMSKAIVAAEPDLSPADQAALEAVPDNVTPMTPIDKYNAAIVEAVSAREGMSPLTTDIAQAAVGSGMTVSEFTTAVSEGSIKLPSDVSVNDVLNQAFDLKLKWAVPTLPTAPDASEMPGITTDSAAAVNADMARVANDVETKAPVETLTTDVNNLNTDLVLAKAAGADISSAEPFVTAAVDVAVGGGAAPAEVVNVFDPVAPASPVKPSTNDLSPAEIQQSIADAGWQKSDVSSHINDLTAELASGIESGTMSSSDIKLYSDELTAFTTALNTNKLQFSPDGQPFTVTELQKFNVEIATKTNPTAEDYAQAAIDSGMTKAEFGQMATAKDLLSGSDITIAQVWDATPSGLEWPTATGTGTGTNNQPGTGNNNQPSNDQPSQEDLAAIATKAEQQTKLALTRGQITESGVEASIQQLQEEASQLETEAADTTDAETKAADEAQAQKDTDIEEGEESAIDE
jgi:hypothetical protein